MSKRKHKSVSSKELYEYYLSTLEPGEFTLSYSKWKEVVFDLMYRLSVAVIRQNLILTLESNLGVVGVEKAKGQAKRKVDYHETKKQGRTVYHDNLHTDCYFFRFAWRRSRAQRSRGRNISLYKFKATQDQTKREIGGRGLAFWTKKCSKDPFIKDYDAPFKIR